MVTISLCMIVKNEEYFLKRCLDCLKDIVDEIIIVDTGSTDRTKEIASKYTQKIYDFEWIQDFSAARNFSFSKASMEYIYVADADEVIDEENIAKFKQLKEDLQSDVDIIEMTYANQLENGSTYNFDEELRPKMYKRLRTFKWVDPIHEVVECHNKCCTSDIKIIHKPLFPHATRDLSIFEKTVSGGKMLSSRLHVMYARELYIAGSDEDFLKAYDYFDRSINESKMTQDDKRISLCVLSRCYGIQQDYHNLLKIAMRILRNNPPSEVCCELGNYYLNCGEYPEAIYWYYYAANSSTAEIDIRYMEFIPNIQLCKCFIELENIEEANSYNDTAAVYKPNDKQVIANKELFARLNLNKV